MSGDDPEKGSLGRDGGPIKIYRTAGSAAFLERGARVAEEVMFYVEGAIAAVEDAVRAGEMPESAVAELRDIHRVVRQRALGTSPQGRLI